jgi:phage portal protein BeeE
MGRLALALRALLGREERADITIDEWANMVSSVAFHGLTYGFGGGLIQQSLGTPTRPIEPVPNDFVSYARGLYQTYDVVFALMAVRMLVFSAVRFQWRQMLNGRPSGLFGTQTLRVLERPWPGGTTQDLLARMIQDVDLVGNSYWTLYRGEQLVRLRPDWTQIILAPRMIRGATMGHEIVGYAYFEGGQGFTKDPVLFSREEVAHFAPYPDPEFNYRGMSWLTPILSEIVNDKLMQRHKRAYLNSGGTPNLVFSIDKAISYEKFRAWKESMREEYDGPENAYKKLFIGGGADVKVVGSNMVEMGFKDLQGHTETRIAAAAGVPPIIVGLSEGLEAATYSNYGQARRRFADGTMHPLWQNVAGSLSVLFSAPGTSDLWYDARDVPFLREDEKDASEILRTRASTIRMLVDAGFTPVSAIAAVEADDLSLLVHTGLFSVQLQKPVTSTGAPVSVTGVPALNGSSA